MRTMASRPGLDVHAPRPANLTRQCFSISRCNSFNPSEPTHVLQTAGLPGLEQGQAELPAWRPSGWMPAAASAGLELTKPCLTETKDSNSLRVTVSTALAAAPTASPAASVPRAAEALVGLGLSEGSLSQGTAAAISNDNRVGFIRRPRHLAAAGTAPQQPEDLWVYSSHGSEAKTTVAARLAAMPLPVVGVQLVLPMKTAPGLQLPLVKRGCCPGWS